MEWYGIMKLNEVMSEVISAIEHLLPAGRAAELKAAIGDAATVAVDAENVVTAVKDAAAKP